MNNACEVWKHCKYSCGWWKGKRGGRTLTNPQGVVLQNWGGAEPNRTVTCMVLKAMDNDRRKKLALCHDEFIGPLSGTADQVALAITTSSHFKSYSHQTLVLRINCSLMRRT
ncbi:hypothetical protein TNCV_447881 [Trichonephila clavipes]|nr:hypothetical protein TNCV_447881 [Trichonephila clavipes]